MTTTPEQIADERAQALVDAVREAAAKVCDRHYLLKLCRQLVGDGGTAASGAWFMVSHLAFDIRSAILEDDPGVKSAIAALSKATPPTIERSE